MSSVSTAIVDEDRDVGPRWSPPAAFGALAAPVHTRERRAGLSYPLGQRVEDSCLCGRHSGEDIDGAARD